MNALPRLDILSLNWDVDLILSSQSSTQNVSQFTPLTSQRSSPASSINLPESSHSGMSYQLPGHLGVDSPSWMKPNQDVNYSGGNDPFEDVFGGLGLEIDGDGNLIGVIDDEPDLPALDSGDNGNIRGMQEQSRDPAGNSQPLQQRDGEHNILIMGEAPLPDAEAFPRHTRPEHTSPSSSSTINCPTSSSIVAPQKKAGKVGKPRNKYPIYDPETQFATAEVRNRYNGYVADMDAMRHHLKAKSAAQAKKNAFALIYGNGIADAGVPFTMESTEFTHPLAENFAGSALITALLGRNTEDLEGVLTRRSRRRVHSEAFEEDQHDDRSVRQRTSEEAELPRRDNSDGIHGPLGDDLGVEFGMDQAAPMDDHHSSSMMPWSRAPSTVPGSSIRGSAKKAPNSQPAPSPLLGKSPALHPIERYSDIVASSDGPGGNLAHMDHDNGIGFDGDTQDSAVELDSVSRKFLGYVVQQMDKGQKPTDDQGRRWVAFEELADPRVHARSIAAQAFLHVLSLATRSAVLVRQDLADMMQPFGEIQIGVDGAAVNIEE